jgi:hypothetical protein
METQRLSNGWQTFVEHWGFATTAIVAVLGSQIVMFFTRLTGAPWIWCYFIALSAGAVGAGLLFYAKLPLYRQRRFFTFGARALPERRRPYYRWAYRFAVFSIVLLACLLLSGH